MQRDDRAVVRAANNVLKDTTYTSTWSAASTIGVATTPDRPAIAPLGAALHLVYAGSDAKLDRHVHRRRLGQRARSGRWRGRAPRLWTGRSRSRDLGELGRHRVRGSDHFLYAAPGLYLDRNVSLMQTDVPSGHGRTVEA